MARARVTDLVVVLPGILGSRLADADGGAVWDLAGADLLRGLRTFGRSLSALRLPKDIGDGDPGDGVVPVGLMPDLHALPGIWGPVDGHTDLLRWLERRFTLSVSDNLLTFPYDWRLSCRYNAERLKGRIDLELERWRASAPERREAQVVFLCHAMGGLVARQYVERLGGHEVTRRLITLGTPHRGCVEALVGLVDAGDPWAWARTSARSPAVCRPCTSWPPTTPAWRAPTASRTPATCRGCPASTRPCWRTRPASTRTCAAPRRGPSCGWSSGSASPRRRPRPATGSA